MAATSEVATAAPAADAAGAGHDPGSDDEPPCLGYILYAPPRAP